jgi:hypothetical protein
MIRLPVARLALAGLMAICTGGCSVAPGDYIDKWFGSGPIQKPAELMPFKPTATAKFCGRPVPATPRNLFLRRW